MRSHTFQFTITEDTFHSMGLNPNPLTDEEFFLFAKGAFEQATEQVASELHDLLWETSITEGRGIIGGYDSVKGCVKP
jgi:hypothetical protein